MTQQQLDRAVARATGETVETIQRRGFGILIVPRQHLRPRDGGAQAGAKPSKPKNPNVQQLRQAA